MGETSKANELQAVLYRMNPDGTGRQKVYSFDPNLTLEGTLALDEQGLYAITKKLSTQKEGNGEYISAAEKTLVYLDLSSYSLTQISDMEFGDNISWDLIGCADAPSCWKALIMDGNLLRKNTMMTMPILSSIKIPTLYSPFWIPPPAARRNFIASETKESIPLPCWEITSIFPLLTMARL